jgi:hypothetical protein
MVVTGTDTIEGIVLGPGENASGYTFAEIAKPQGIRGVVYADVNNNGRRDRGERGIRGVRIILTGFNDLGEAVRIVKKTNRFGKFRFRNLRPGVYTLTEVQPGKFIDGKDSAGNLGGNVGNDVISQIVLNPGGRGKGYAFGERGLKAKMVSKKDFLTNTGQ